GRDWFGEHPRRTSRGRHRVRRSRGAAIRAAIRSPQSAIAAQSVVLARFPVCRSGGPSGPPSDGLKAVAYTQTKSALGRGKLFFEQLFPVELRVEAVFANERVMCAALGDASFVQDEDHVGVADRGNAV